METELNVVEVCDVCNEERECCSMVYGDRRIDWFSCGHVYLIKDECVDVLVDWSKSIDETVHINVEE